MVADAVEVRRGGRPEPGEARPGERRLGAASVARTTRPLDEPVIDEAVDEACDAALGQQQRVGEPAHAEPLCRRLGELEQGLVFLKRQCVAVTQILVEPPRDASVRTHERPPRTEVDVGGGEMVVGRLGGVGHPAILQRERSMAVPATIGT